MHDILIVNLYKILVGLHSFSLLTKRKNNIIMKNFFFHKNKYLIGSAGLFLAAFSTNSAVFQGLATASLLYNSLERNGIIEAEMHPDIQARKLHLTE